MLRALQKYFREVKKASTPRGFELKETQLLWDFTKEDTLREWICINDEEVKGLSTATLRPNGKGIDPSKRSMLSCPVMEWFFFCITCVLYTCAGTGALFQGSLSTEIPRGSSAKHSGFCAIQSKPGKVCNIHV